MTELTLETVTAKAPDQLAENESAFIKEHAGELSDEQKTTFKGILEPKQEEEVKPEYRFTKKETKPADDEDDEDDGTDPEDKKVISRMVEKGLKPFKDQLQEQNQTTRNIQDQTEVDSFITNRPEAKPYRNKMLTYMKAEHYNALPAHAIFKIVAGDDLEKIGAEREREAREQAEATRTGGSSVRPTGSGGKDWSKASPEEIANKKAEIFNQQ